MNNQSTTQPRSALAAWRSRNRGRLQAAALIVVLGAPFGLHWALGAGLNILATILFAAIALSMALVIWVS
jgi:hypothetical protein